MGVRSFGNSVASFRSRFGKTGARASRLPFSASGGNVSALAPGNGYKYHTFTSPGNFIVSGSSVNVELLVVAGGGGGGPGYGGGGGAGGLVYAPTITLSTGTYSIVVGTGGGDGVPGNPSIFSPATPIAITALGGGGGGGGENGGSPGGSGGGTGGTGPSVNSFPIGSSTQPGQANPPAVLQYGNPGGRSPGYPYIGNGGGGGGAGGAGNPGPGPGTSGPAGPGGDGRQYTQFAGPLIGLPALNPYSGYFAGGGGGANVFDYPPPNAPSGKSTGGLGGGGTGGATPGLATAGANYTGSGGGAGGFNPSGYPGAPGGSGIVIIRYLA